MLEKVKEISNKNDMGLVYDRLVVGLIDGFTQELQNKVSSNMAEGKYEENIELSRDLHELTKLNKGDKEKEIEGKEEENDYITIEQIDELLGRDSEYPIEIRMSTTREGITVKAYGEYYENGDVTVKKGSQVQSTETVALHEGTKRLRKENLYKEDYNESGGYYEIKDDLYFESPSGAACFIGGSSLSGNQVWFVGDIKLGDYLEYLRG